MPDTPSTQLRFSKSFWKHRFFQDAGDEEDTYVFPTEKLSPEAPADSGKQNILLVACGSFSPLTYMHLRMFETARDALLRENYHVIGGLLSPVHDEYNKIGLVGSSHRLNMCLLGTQSSEWMDVDPWETLQPSYCRSLLVLRHFRESLTTNGFPNTRVLLLCGADMLKSFMLPGVWNESHVQEILTVYGVCVIERQGVNARELIQEHDLLFENSQHIHIIPEWILNDVSSTKIRRNVRRGQSIRYLIPEDVEQYIYRHKLFKSQEQQAFQP